MRKERTAQTEQYSENGRKQTNKQTKDVLLAFYYKTKATHWILSPMGSQTIVKSSI